MSTRLLVVILLITGSIAKSDIPLMLEPQYESDTDSICFSKERAQLIEAYFQREEECKIEDHDSYESSGWEDLLIGLIGGFAVGVTVASRH